MNSPFFAELPYACEISLIFGHNRERMTATHRRCERLFGLLLNSGLCISEDLAFKTSDVRLAGCTTRPVQP